MTNHECAGEPPVGNCTITPRRNGPLLVEGPVSLVGANGTIEVVDRLFLCRCGASAKKPLCDGTHKRIGFEAPGREPTSRTPK